jgi:hypothetical protein
MLFICRNISLRGKEVSASFFEKKGSPPGEAKKLLLNVGRDRAGATARRTESFLPQAGSLLFFKKEALS